MKGRDQKLPPPPGMMGGGGGEVGESDTEGDVAKEWGENMDNGGEEEVYQSVM
jgi:hypothetical protein